MVTAPSDLRRRVLRAIGGDTMAPPGIDDIAAALDAQDITMLVYLLPQDDDGPGGALIVGREGTVHAVLAACASDHSGHEHDEALTLATAFLAAGAIGVVGARWAVEDLATAVFKVMFHHYLNAGYENPAAAPRVTQLWMLNPRRRLPEWLDRQLADELAGPEVDRRAAFTYQGR